MEGNLDLYKINTSLKEKSLKKMYKFSLSEIDISSKSNFSTLRVYEIKNNDVSKQRFAQDTLISKIYEKSIYKNLFRWSKLFGIDNKGLKFDS